MSFLLTGTVSTQYDNIGCHGDKDYYAINMVGLLDKIFTNLESLEVIKGSAINEKEKLLTQEVGSRMMVESEGVDGIWERLGVQREDAAPRSPWGTSGITGTSVCLIVKQL